MGMRAHAVVASWVVPASNRVAGRRGICEPAQRVGLCGSSTTILPCRVGRGRGHYRPSSWGPACRLSATPLFVRSARADSLGRGRCHIIGVAAGCRGAHRRRRSRRLPSVGNLVAVKLAGHLGVTGSPLGACWELAADAHRETARIETARGGGSASALSSASCDTGSPIDPPPSKRHIY